MTSRPVSRRSAVRPLSIVDFNMFGSTVGMEDLDGVRVWNADDLEKAVTAYADAMCADESFNLAVEDAEAWIRDRMPVALAEENAGERRPAVMV